MRALYRKCELMRISAHTCVCVCCALRSYRAHLSVGAAPRRVCAVPCRRRFCLACRSPHTSENTHTRHVAVAYATATVIIQVDALTLCGFGVVVVSKTTTQTLILINSRRVFANFIPSHAAAAPALCAYKCGFVAYKPHKTFTRAKTLRGTYSLCCSAQFTRAFTSKRLAFYVSVYINYIRSSLRRCVGVVGVRQPARCTANKRNQLKSISPSRRRVIVTLTSRRIIMRVHRLASDRRCEPRTSAANS